MKKFFVSILLAGHLAPASAGYCDYALSNVIGAAATAAVEVVAVAAASTGPVLKRAGLYPIKHAITGAQMLGSTAAGASAAKTMGILPGTAGALGSIVAALMSPVVIVPAAVIAVTVVAVEAGCHLADKN